MDGKQLNSLKAVKKQRARLTGKHPLMQDLSNK
jgi:hypothetical protein